MNNQPNSWNVSSFAHRYGFPIFTVLLFIALFAIAIFSLVREARTFADEIITQDVQTLAGIFKRIDGSCAIVEFEHQQNYIDFLTVEKFVGVEVGAMHLMAPEKWQGPYLREHLKVYGKHYMIVRTKKGYFIVPPIGLKLSNGKIVGVDLKLDESADIEQMIKSPKGLQYKDKPLAAKISISGIKGVLTKPIVMPDEEAI